MSAEVECTVCGGPADENGICIDCDHPTEECICVERNFA